MKKESFEGLMFSIGLRKWMNNSMSNSTLSVFEKADFERRPPVKWGDVGVLF